MKSWDVYVSMVILANNVKKMLISVFLIYFLAILEDNVTLILKQDVNANILLVVMILVKMNTKVVSPKTNAIKNTNIVIN